MRDLMTYASECMEMLDVINIHYGNVVEWQVNTRAKRRWGQTKVVPGGFSINISSVLLDERNDETALENTIIHELLHTCPGCFNHGTTWKALAAKVGREYGYTIQRCSSPEEKGVVADTLSIAPAVDRYKIRCRGCGQTISRERLCKCIKHPESYRCGICGGDFERIA